MTGPSLHLTGLYAEADLSALQYRFVKVTGDKVVNVCDTAGEEAIGVLRNKPTAGAAASVETLGQVVVAAGAAIAAGAKVTTDVNGRAITAASGNAILGTALEAAAALGDLIAIDQRPGAAVVTP